MKCCSHMRIKVSFGFCAMVCLLAWLNARLCIWFLASILCHELGHLLALRLCRAVLEGISLEMAGAVIQTSLAGYRQEILCAAAGPAANCLLGAAVLRLQPQLAVISLLLAAVNLLPLYPLDGGRILRAALLLHCSQEKAERILHVVTVGVCCILMVLACWITVELQAGLWPIFAALILLWRAGEREKP